MYSVLFGFFGAVCGSFIYASVVRIARKESIVKTDEHTPARSHCDTCGHTLNFFDLIPILSFVVLRGRCQYCHASIARGHVVAEVMYACYGALIGATQYSFGIQWVLFVYGGVLIFTFFYDLSYFQILDGVMLPSILMCVPLSFFILRLTPESIALGALIGGGFFAVQYIVSRGRWIGDGDIRLGVLMGVMLGWQHTIVALFIAYIIGALCAAVLLIQKKASLTARIPFGTFLSFSTLVVLLYGQQILDWYLHLVLLA